MAGKRRRATASTGKPRRRRDPEIAFALAAWVGDVDRRLATAAQTDKRAAEDLAALRRAIQPPTVVRLHREIDLFTAGPLDDLTGAEIRAYHATWATVWGDVPPVRRRGPRTGGKGSGRRYSDRAKRLMVAAVDAVSPLVLRAHRPDPQGDALEQLSDTFMYALDRPREEAIEVAMADFAARRSDAVDVAAAALRALREEIDPPLRGGLPETIKVALARGWLESVLGSADTAEHLERFDDERAGPRVAAEWVVQTMTGVSATTIAKAVRAAPRASRATRRHRALDGLGEFPQE